jgi:general secretion pathway protein D
MLKALQSQGRLQVLSNPSVMAANNQPAHIQVGENIGRASGQTITGGGNQQTSVEFEDIGVILDVTPSINPDGFVRMEIEPSITDLTNREIQVTEDLAVPVLTKREATTTVTVRDGQTIVLGGLISDEYEERQWKIPILGDIPLVGLIFRSEQKDTKKIELLIVLTPHVITSPADEARVRYITEQEIQRLTVDDEEKQRLREARVIPKGMQEEEPNPGVDQPAGTPPEETPAEATPQSEQSGSNSEEKTVPEGRQEPQDVPAVDEGG